MKPGILLFIYLLFILLPGVMYCNSMGGRGEIVNNVFSREFYNNKDFNGYHVAG